MQTTPYPACIARCASALLLFLSSIVVPLTAQDIPLVYEVEHTGRGFPKPASPTLELLPVIPRLPDPFAWADGSGRDTSFSSWSRHRAEAQARIEHYEIGLKPDTADLTIEAAYANGILTVVVLRNARSLTLTARITVPAGAGPFPAVIGMSLAPGSGTGSLPANIFTSRNIASIEYLHNQVTTYAAGQQVSHAADPFYVLYPELSTDANSGQYAAWSWGVSRLIDGLYLARAKATPLNPFPIDLRRLAVTGCSYAGKMALFAGALDERIALTIAQESGGGGAPAWRVSHAIEPNGTVEKIDNTDTSWFRDDLRQFSGDNVYKLPHDHHQLMALVAPRALLVTGNTDFTWLSNRAAYVTARAAHEVYKTWGIGDRFGFYIDGGHGHCAVPAAQIPAIEAFVEKFLLGIAVPTDVQVHPFPSLEYASWTQEWADRTPPVTTASASPQPKPNGWNDGPVVVTFSATSEHNDVKEIAVTLSGAQTGNYTFASSWAQVTVFAEGSTTVTYGATDHAGNVEAAKELQVNLRMKRGR